uniref:Uncharacterized protein n=1 Tax=Arundo donax TaxID=35708 RepID=A0A0A9HBN8_ARUDO
MLLSPFIFPLPWPSSWLVTSSGPATGGRPLRPSAG